MRSGQRYQALTRASLTSSRTRPAPSRAVRISPTAWFHWWLRVWVIGATPSGGLHVGVLFLPGHGLLLLEVGLVEAEPLGGVVSDSHEDEVVIAQDEASARAQQTGHDARPEVDVGQPAQNTQRGVNQVEVPSHGFTGCVDVGLDQLDAGTSPPRQLPSPLQ